MNMIGRVHHAVPSGCSSRQELELLHLNDCVCPALSYFASKTKSDRSLLINIVLQASSLVEQSVSDSHQDLEEAADAILLEDATARQTHAWRREQLMDPYAGLMHPHG